jgi:hypothetical protein
MRYFMQQRILVLDYLLIAKANPTSPEIIGAAMSMRANPIEGAATVKFAIYVAFTDSNPLYLPKMLDTRGKLVSIND